MRNADNLDSLTENVEFIDNGGKVVIPRRLWDRMIEELEDNGLLKAMEEAEDTPLLTKDEALKLLDELDELDK